MYILLLTCSRGPRKESHVLRFDLFWAKQQSQCSSCGMETSFVHTLPFHPTVSSVSSRNRLDYNGRHKKYAIDCCSNKLVVLPETVEQLTREVQQMINSFVVIFPDESETKLALCKWTRTENVLISSLQKEISLDNVELTVILNPGFQIDEWFRIEYFCKHNNTVILLNADLDKVRSGYYPKIFYPRLHKAKDRYLIKFEPVYYVKFISNGALIRRYPEHWQILYLEKDHNLYCIHQTKERPDFHSISYQLKQHKLQQ
eukprot:jgi/Galph1/4453/GphlegSOOS_G3105.1